MEYSMFFGELYYSGDPTYCIPSFMICTALKDKCHEQASHTKSRRITTYHTVYPLRCLNVGIETGQHLLRNLLLSTGYKHSATEFYRTRLLSFCVLQAISLANPWKEFQCVYVPQNEVYVVFKPSTYLKSVTYTIKSCRIELNEKQE